MIVIIIIIIIIIIIRIDRLVDIDVALSTTDLFLVAAAGDVARALILCHVAIHKGAAPALVAGLETRPPVRSQIALILAFGDGQLVVPAFRAHERLEGRRLRVVPVASQGNPRGRRGPQENRRRRGGALGLGGRGAGRGRVVESLLRDDAVGLEVPRLAVETDGRVPLAELLGRDREVVAGFFAQVMLLSLSNHSTHEAIVSGSHCMPGLGPPAAQKRRLPTRAARERRTCIVGCGEVDEWRGYSVLLREGGRGILQVVVVASTRTSR